MLAILDYGVGNLFSLVSSFRSLGADAVITSDAEVVQQSDRVILPGVGAFGDAAKRLKASGLRAVLIDQAHLGKPVLGVCLGMQLLFDKSLEYGEHAGLGLIPGVVRPLEGLLPAGYKVPHMGWNGLHFSAPRSPLFDGLSEGAHVYFVHSYAAMDCAESTLATSEYSVPVTAAVGRNNVFGTQFHPEKSGDVGLHILLNFMNIR